MRSAPGESRDRRDPELSRRFSVAVAAGQRGVVAGAGLRNAEPEDVMPTFDEALRLLRGPSGRGYARYSWSG